MGDSVMAQWTKAAAATHDNLGPISQNPQSRLEPTPSSCPWPPHVCPSPHAQEINVVVFCFGLVLVRFSLGFNGQHCSHTLWEASFQSSFPEFPLPQCPPALHLSLSLRKSLFICLHFTLGFDLHAGMCQLVLCRDFPDRDGDEVPFPQKFAGE